MGKPEVAKKESQTTFIQSILKEIVESKGWEIIFQVLLYGFVIWGLYNLTILYQFHTGSEYAHLPKYSMYEFKLSLVMVAFFLLYRSFCQFVFFGIVKRNLNTEKYPTEEERAAKAKVVCLWIGSILYYTLSSLSAFFLFKDQEFFPKLLGGKGEPSAMFKAMPAAWDIQYGVEFYMIQFGSHLHTLIDYIVYKRNDSKFWEMFLHHSLAVFLIFFSYTTNNITVGIMVLFVHDPCDIFFYISRMLSDLKYKVVPLKTLVYVVFLASWIFFRLYAFPKCIVAACFDFVQASHGTMIFSPILFMTLMLSALVLLHCYWFVFILRAGVVIMFKKGSNYNVYDKKKPVK